MAAALAYASQNAPVPGLRLALPLSLALHVLCAVLLVSSLTANPPPVPPMRTVSVELISPEEFEAMRPPATDAAAQDSASSSAPGDDMIHAASVLSTRVLDDPRNRQARDALPGLAPGERILQVCNLEAIEQVAAWDPGFEPDYIIAYAMADISMSPQEIRADVGAMHSGHDWYAIRYRCMVSPDRSKVVAFDFKVGDPIPESDWGIYNLPAGGDMDHGD